MRAQISFLLAVQAALGSPASQASNWIAAGDHALYEGRSAEAAADYRKALEEQVRAGTRGAALVHLQVNLATALLEAGDIHGAEGVLRQADQASAGMEGGRARAEWLNTCAALHTFQGKWNETERELAEARAIMLRSPQPGDLLPAVLHNLAAIEMKTGAYSEALNNERDALSLWRKMLNPDHPHMVKCWAGLGALQYLTGRPREAHLSLERAIASARKTFGPAHPLLADLLESDALVLDRLNSRNEAKQARAEAQQIRKVSHVARSDRRTWNMREALAPDSDVYLSLK